MLDAMRDDTDAILLDWQETLTIKRGSATYNAQHIASVSWTSVGTFAGDWQPVSGATRRAEAGASIKSEAQVIAAYDVDVAENDRIERADGSFMYVNYVQSFEDHVTIFLKRTAGSQ